MPTRRTGRSSTTKCLLGDWSSTATRQSQRYRSRGVNTNTDRTIAGLEVVAVANPRHSVTGDTAYVRDVITGIDKPFVLVGHFHRGVVIAEAATGNKAVVGLVYVNVFAPEHMGECAGILVQFPGSSPLLEQLSCPCRSTMEHQGRTTCAGDPPHASPLARRVCSSRSWVRYSSSSATTWRAMSSTRRRL